MGAAGAPLQPPFHGVRGCSQQNPRQLMVPCIKTPSRLIYAIAGVLSVRFLIGGNNNNGEVTNRVAPFGVVSDPFGCTPFLQAAPGFVFSA